MIPRDSDYESDVLVIGCGIAGASTALAAATDEASFKAAFPELGNSCKGCHEKFRRPKG